MCTCICMCTYTHTHTHTHDCVYIYQFHTCVCIYTETEIEMPKRKACFYGVRHGFTPGVYEDWEDCKRQVNNHKFFLHSREGERERNRDRDRDRESLTFTVLSPSIKYNLFTLVRFFCVVCI